MHIISKQAARLTARLPAGKNGGAVRVMLASRVLKAAPSSIQVDSHRMLTSQRLRSLCDFSSRSAAMKTWLLSGLGRIHTLLYPDKRYAHSKQEVQIWVKSP